MKSVTLKVEGMSCGHCKMSIESALLKQDGIETAEVVLAEKNVSIVYDDTKIQLNQIKEIIEDQGFDVYL